MKVLLSLLFVGHSFVVTAQSIEDILTFEAPNFEFLELDSNPIWEE